MVLVKPWNSLASRCLQGAMEAAMGAAVLNRVHGKTLILPILPSLCRVTLAWGRPPSDLHYKTVYPISP